MRFDPYTPEFVADPYPTYRALLAAGGVHDTTFGIPAVCRYDDCNAVLTSPLWSADPRKVDPVRRMFAPRETDTRLLVKLDSPAHTSLRRPFSAPLASLGVAKYERLVRDITDAVLDDLPQDACVDLMQSFVVPVTVRTVAAVMGLGRECETSLAEWGLQLSNSSELKERGSDAALAERAAMAGLRGLFAKLTEQRRQVVEPDLWSAVVARDVEHAVADDIFASNGAFLAAAAQEQPISLIANSLIALLTARDQLECFRDEPQHEPGAIEELVRYVSPVQARPRVATFDVVLAGRQFRAGDQVLVLIAAANRDPRAFIEPDTLDIARRDNRHLGFGAGPHRCLGAHLGKLQARTALTRFVRRFPDAKLATSSVRYAPRFVDRRPARLDINLGRSRVNR
jgi:unspecific monooxygenase